MVRINACNHPACEVISPHYLEPWKSGERSEADTLEVLEYKLQTMIPEFADLNDVVLPRSITFSVHNEKAIVTHD
jgi:hypothetical protein